MADSSLPSLPFVNELHTFYDQQDGSKTWKQLIPSLQQHLRAHRPERFTDDRLYQLILRLQRRVANIHRKQREVQQARADMQDAEDRLNASRVTAARRRKWEEENAHIIAAYSEAKDVELNPQDEAEEKVVVAMERLKDKRIEGKKRKKEEVAEAKRSKRQRQEEARREKQEQQAREKEEKAAEETRKAVEREEKKQRVRDKRANQIMELKLERLKKSQQTAEDVERKRRVERKTERVLDIILSDISNEPDSEPMEHSEAEGEENERPER